MKTLYELPLTARLKRRLQRRSMPKPPGKLIDSSSLEFLTDIQENFSQVPACQDLTSTALQEAKLMPKSPLNPQTESFLASLGRLPHRGLMESITLSKWDCGDYFQEYIAFKSHTGLMIPAYVLVPKQKIGPHPAVISIHGHGGDFLWGKSKITAQLEGRPSFGYGRKLVRQGFLVLAPDLAPFEERDFSKSVHPGPWPENNERLLFSDLLLKGSTLLGWNLFELSRAVDYLCTRADTPSSNISVIGHSMGGTLAPFLALFDNRIKTAVSACGISTWAEMTRRHVLHNFSFYSPGMVETYDLDQMLCNIAPRPFMIIAGRYDDNFPEQGVNDIANAMKKQYTKMNVPERVTVSIYSSGHSFTNIMQDDAVKFLDKWTNDVIN